MLDKLPIEILHLILSEFVTTPEIVHGDIAAYRAQTKQRKIFGSLCQTSRHLKDVAEPLLYHNYVKPDSASDHAAYYSFRKFLTTLLKRPELQPLVRALYIGPWKQNSTQSHLLGRCSQYAVESESPECLAKVCAVHFPQELHDLYDAYAASSIFSPDWKDALSADDERAEIALLMSLTPNLECLEFSMPHLDADQERDPQYFWPQLLVPSTEWDPFKHFHRLKSVTVHARSLDTSRRAGTGFEIDPFLPFIGLPNLQVFWVEGARRGTFDRRIESYPLNDMESPLTDLTLSPSHIHPTKLRHILRRCPKLEAFYFEFDQEDEFIPDFSWKSVGQMLYQSRHSIAELTLDADLMSQLATEMFAQSEGSCIALGSLRGFTSLKSLDVIQTVLLGFENLEDDITLVVPSPPFEEILPGSLETLTIQLATMTVVPYLEDLLACVPEKFPRLEAISVGHIDLIDFNTDDHDESVHRALMRGREERVERLKEGFIKAGIEWM